LQAKFQVLQEEKEEKEKLIANLKTEIKNLEMKIIQLER
jgi:hypothetical protein